MTVAPSSSGPPDDAAGVTQSAGTTPQSGPARPVVEDGKVRAGGVTVPVPDGWQVAREDRAICETAPKTVFVGAHVMPGGSCAGDQPIIHVNGYSVNGALRLPDGQYGQVILPGGQPAWVPLTQMAALSDGPSAQYRALSLILPWSGAEVDLTMSRGDPREIFDTITTDPVAPTRLAPPSATTVRLSDGRSPARSIGLAGERTVRSRLLQLSDVVPADAACGTNQPMTRLELLDLQGRIQEATFISGTPQCAQATSSLGGRVRVPAGFLFELTQLFANGTVSR